LFFQLKLTFSHSQLHCELNFLNYTFVLPTIEPTKPQVFPTNNMMKFTSILMLATMLCVTTKGSSKGRSKYYSTSGIEKKRIIKKWRGKDAVGEKIELDKFTGNVKFDVENFKLNDVHVRFDLKSILRV